MSQQRILLCDDDPQILGALSLILRDAGYVVLRAASAEQALDRVAVEAPRLAIIDLLLPDRHGIELIRSLREWSEMPIVVLSAISDEQMKIEALEQGADDYVTKPFAAGELLARVRAALRRAARDAREPRVQAGGLIVDLAAHQVRRDGEQLHLTPTEFALLRALVINRGMLLTHRQLLAEVWGTEYGEATPVLRTHIANLRGKLQAGGDQPHLIATEPGIGYRFSA